jgi:hypothetical protein
MAHLPMQGWLAVAAASVVQTTAPLEMTALLA